MKWKDFEESSKEYPEKIVEKSIEGFSRATKGLVELSISPLSDSARLFAKVSGDFIFNVTLFSPHVKDYKFKVLTFGYNIELEPINYIVDEGIHMEIYEELFLEGQYMICKDGESFAKELEKIFTSSKFVEIVTGLMKIARKYSEKK